MNSVFQDLYRFSAYAEAIDLTFNQYLLLADDPMLVHTGNIMQAKNILPQLQEILAGKTLKYIFVSHFENDECGGLSEMLKVFPEAKVLCSDVTAKQLKGFGLAGDTITQNGGDTFSAAGLELQFITYPSEMHLWDGLLLVESKRKIFFSSDLVFRFGKVEGDGIQGDWQKEVEGITPEQIPDMEKRLRLQQTLKGMDIAYIATGHGPCVKLQ